jgi:hypothetical protein
VSGYIQTISVVPFSVTLFIECECDAILTHMSGGVKQTKRGVDGRMFVNKQLCGVWLINFCHDNFKEVLNLPFVFSTAVQ